MMNAEFITHHSALSVNSCTLNLNLDLDLLLGYISGVNRRLVE
jgi:hypothetical protein